MSAAYVARRSGWDGPNRIATTAEMVTLASELLPGEPMYQPIPFYPAITSGSDALGSGDDVDSWSNGPTRVDLTFYQGDDVTIPLTIEDPGDTAPDRSTTWEWGAQIRVLHTYHSTLLASFAVEDQYFPAAPPNVPVGFTQVNLFLPRSENLYAGTYHWDLYSRSPLDVASYPQPPEVVDPEPWPPIDQIRTWLYGKVTILPRVTSTDFLPYVPVPPVNTGNVMIPHAFVGPNGQVP